jgi:hypothetical protein
MKFVGVIERHPTLALPGQTGDPSHDATGEELTQKIDAALAARLSAAL